MCIDDQELLLLTQINGCTIEVLVWISNFIPHFIMLGLKLLHVSKMGGWFYSGKYTRLVLKGLTNWPLIVPYDMIKLYNKMGGWFDSSVYKIDNKSVQVMACSHQAPSHGLNQYWAFHYIMSMVAFQIAGFSIVCSSICSGTDQRNHQSSASLAFVRRIHRSPADSLHKGPVMWKMFPFDNIIIYHQ